jgi:K+-sensing histidine kinase KdpD
MEVVRCDDVRAAGAPPHIAFPSLVSYLAVPVISRSGRVIGGLFFGHSKPGMFSERNERLVLGLASQAAIALDNAALYQEAQQLIEALERSNKDLDQFAYVTSHDLKAPLRGTRTCHSSSRRISPACSPTTPASTCASCAAACRGSSSWSKASCSTAAARACSRSRRRSRSARSRKRCGS